MSRERAEEILLITVALGMVSFLIEGSFAQRLGVSVLISIALIGILILRNLDWHAQGGTPFDGVLLAGVGATLIHLASFNAFTSTILSTLLVLVSVVFYASMAMILYQHRTWWLATR